jgi:hypothetical protein
MTQRLESDLRKTLNKRYAGTYFLKLFNHPITHRRTPSDFLVLTEDKNLLIECKETRKLRFDFSRLTQYNDMALFEAALLRNSSYLLIMFYSGRLLKSSVFLVPIAHIPINFKSISLKDAEVLWADFKVEILGNGLFNLDRIVKNRKVFI